MEDFFYIRKVLLNNNKIFKKAEKNVAKTNKTQVNNILQNPNLCFTRFEKVNNNVLKFLKCTWTMLLSEISKLCFL